MVDGLFFFVIFIIVLGMGAGYAAHLLLEPHRRPHWSELFVVGIIGSFVGGIVGGLIFNHTLEFHPSGIIGSVLGAIAVLYVYQLIKGKRHIIEESPEHQKEHQGAAHPGSGSHHETRHTNKPGRKNKQARKKH